MKNLIRIAPRLLWIVSVAYILLYLFLFIEIDAIFPKADILGELLYNLALSIIAANLFYLFIDYFPREARKRKLLTHLDIHIGIINSQIEYILKYLNCPKSVKALSINERDFQSIKECLEKTPMNFVVPNKENVRGQVMRILEYINDKCLRIVEETKDLQLDKEVYSAELYILLLKIKNARFHK